MRWLLRLYTTVRSLLRARSADRELNEELQFHLDREIREHLDAGWSVEAARLAAVRAMGPTERSREECRDLRPGQRVGLMVGQIVQDIRFALRLFRRHPAPIGIAVVGLGVAIGVATGVFSIVNATLLRPYGMHDPATVVAVSRYGGWPIWSYRDFATVRRATTLATLEAAEYGRVRFGQTATAEGLAGQRALFVTGNYLPLFGARPALGRTLGPADDVQNAPPAIVVSDYFWRTKLAGDPDIVGDTVWVNDAPATLVGVLEPGFTGPMRNAIAIWATFASFDDLHMGPEVTATSGPQVQVVGRLSSGVERPALQANIRALLAESGRGTDGHREAEVHSASSPIAGMTDVESYVVLSLVLGLVGMLLALACANVANLLMASAWARVREIGVRLAMGATRRRLVMQMVTESTLIGLAAGALGLLLSFLLLPVLSSLAETWPENDLTPDRGVYLFALAVGLASGLGAGLAPARFGARGNLIGAIQFGNSGRGGQGVPSRHRMSLVGVQAALSMMLLVVAILFTRSALRMTSVDIGFDANRLVAVWFDAPRADFDEPLHVLRAAEAVRALPSVERVSVSQHAPFGPSEWRDRLDHEGQSFVISRMAVDAEFFTTVQLRLLRGRTFTADEVSREAPVVVISDTMARRFFRDQDPIGRSITQVPSRGGEPRSPAAIIGVVADSLMTRVDAEAFGAIFEPLARTRSNPPTLLIRTARPDATIRSVEQALRGIDPRVQATAALVKDRIDDYLGMRRRLAWILGPVAALSLILAGLGIYGVASFLIGFRTEEVSVRMALGASAQGVLRLLVVDTLRPVVVGLIVGLGLALVFSRFVAVEELPGVSPFDPTSIGFALAALLGCALAAALIPARRASRANPAELLRRG